MQVTLSRQNAGARTLAVPSLRSLARGAAACAVVAAAYLGSAWYAGIAPFPSRELAPYSPEAVLRAVPFDAPLPYDISVVEAGRGGQLPYHVVYRSPNPPDVVDAQISDHLAGSPKWQLTETTPIAGEFTTHLARLSADAQMTHFAALSVQRDGTGSIIVFDFTPIPASLAPK